MLPAPVSFPKRRGGGGVLTLHPAVRRDLQSILRAPARLTNLSALLLVATAFFSLLLNLRHWLGISTDLAGLFGTLPPSIAATFVPPQDVRELNHLVLVPGHGVWLGSRPDDLLDENYWLLAEYQRNRRRPVALLSHIRTAIDIASRDPGALLIFSGGQTSAAPTTEAESYARLATTAGLLPPPSSDASARTPNLPHYTTELYALDSFQNLLFALARFREYTGHFPARVSVVGFAFKGTRFRELHARALGWPARSFEYVGVPLPDAMDEANAAKGELENAYLPYTEDLYGCRPPLSDKRASRNIARRSHAYHFTAPEMASLLEWCPMDGASVYPGTLPWKS